MKRNKKQLYESIMKDISKSIKSKLNEEYEVEEIDNNDDIRSAYKFYNYINIEFEWDGITYNETFDVDNDIDIYNDSFWQSDKTSDDMIYDFEINGSKDEDGNLLTDVWIEVYKHGKGECIKYIYNVKVIDFE